MGSSGFAECAGSGNGSEDGRRFSTCGCDSFAVVVVFFVDVVVPRGPPPGGAFIAPLGRPEGGLSDLAPSRSAAEPGRSFAVTAGDPASDDGPGLPTGCLGVAGVAAESPTT